MTRRAIMFVVGGVAVAAKHFPGHGDTTADTHHHMARVTASMAELSERELVPFAAAIDASVDAILTAHVVADALDTEPASLSARWSEHLRGMGFDGVIITDALDMDAVARGRGVDGVADAAVLALRAGADLLCLGSNFDAAMTNAVIGLVVAGIDHGQLDRVACSIPGLSARRVVGDSSTRGQDPKGLERRLENQVPASSVLRLARSAICHRAQQGGIPESGASVDSTRSRCVDRA